jgi:hypothetical protein
MADDGAGGPADLPNVAGLAVAGIAVISAVTGIVGGLTGGVARVARNTWWVLPLATFLVFVAVGLALAASLVSRTPAPPSEPAHPPRPPGPRSCGVSAPPCFGFGFALRARIYRSALCRADPRTPQRRPHRGLKLRLRSHRTKPARRRRLREAA